MRALVPTAFRSLPPLSARTGRLPDEAPGLSSGRRPGAAPQGGEAQRMAMAGSAAAPRAWHEIVVEALKANEVRLVPYVPDNVLKPLLMARGLPVPMLVILIGVLGGTLKGGITGLFVGPVLLSLGYHFLRLWVGISPELES